MNFLIIVGVLGFAGAAWFLMTAQSTSADTGGTGSLPPSPNAGPAGSSQGGGSATTFDGKVQSLARAIAIAEGANLPGSVPYRFGNPGDLSVGDDFFGTATGSTVLPDGENILTFTPGPSWDSGDGWDALVEKVRRWLAGESRTYTLDMTFAQVGRLYAADYGSWVMNVTTRLGVTADTTLREYINS